jgi:hypothetical protein
LEEQTTVGSTYNDVIHSGKMVNYFVRKIQPEDVKVYNHVKDDIAKEIIEQLPKFLETEYLNFYSIFDNALPKVRYEIIHELKKQQKQ